MVSKKRVCVHVCKTELTITLFLIQKLLVYLINARTINFNYSLFVNQVQFCNDLNGYLTRILVCKLGKLCEKSAEIPEIWNIS